MSSSFLGYHTSLFSLFQNSFLFSTECNQWDLPLSISYLSLCQDIWLCEQVLLYDHQHLLQVVHRFLEYLLMFQKVFKLSLFAFSQSIRLRIFGITSEIMSFVDFMQLDELVSSAYIVTCPFLTHKGRSFM